MSNNPPPPYSTLEPSAALSARAVRRFRVQREIVSKLLEVLHHVDLDANVSFEPGSTIGLLYLQEAASLLVILCSNFD